MIRRSTVATGQAVNQLTESGVLTVRSVGKQRYRVFEAPDVTRLITRLDRNLSMQSPPARDVGAALNDPSGDTTFQQVSTSASEDEDPKPGGFYCRANASDIPPLSDPSGVVSPVCWL